MPNWIDNSVRPLNDAAKEFTKKHMLNSKGKFCFGNLFVSEDYQLSPVSLEEFQAFKDKNREEDEIYEEDENYDPVHCEYEQDGLLYTMGKDGAFWTAVCTTECSERLEVFDRGSMLCVKTWGTEEQNDNGETIGYNFSTACIGVKEDEPWDLMEALTKKCPEGIWEWRCSTACGCDSLLIRLHYGAIVIIEHFVDEDVIDNFHTIDDLHWDDTGGVPSKYVDQYKNVPNTKLVPSKVFSVKLNRCKRGGSISIGNFVRPRNDAAKEFAKKYMVNEEGLFCFGKLLPTFFHEYIDITQSPSHIVSPEEFRAFKAEHQPSVHSEYEQEGLLYTLDEDGNVGTVVCTTECSKRLEVLVEVLGTRYSNLCVKTWGTEEKNDNGELIGYSFATANLVGHRDEFPWDFMLELTMKCPEGIWEWRCKTDYGCDSLLIRLHYGAVVIVEHFVDEDFINNFHTIDDLFWDDMCGVLGQCSDEYNYKYNNDNDIPTKLVPSKVFSVKLNRRMLGGSIRIDNSVRPLNDAAKEFTKKHMVDDRGLFCFGRLVPVPDILSKTDAYTRIVSLEEFHAFKAEHQSSVHCEYEQDGLLYTLKEDVLEDEDSAVELAVCTAEGSARLKDMYGCDNYLDFRIQNWGTTSEASHYDDDDDDGYDDDDDDYDYDYDEDDDVLEYYNFLTEWYPPWVFMSTITSKCPEGVWEWRCNRGFESLLIKLHDGKVVITEHLLDKEMLESRRKTDGEQETIDILHWNDRGEVPDKGKNDTKLVLGKVFSVKPNYVVPKQTKLA